MGWVINPPVIRRGGQREPQKKVHVRTESETRRILLRVLASTVPKVNADLTNDTKSLPRHFFFC